MKRIARSSLAAGATSSQTFGREGERGRDEWNACDRKGDIERHVERERRLRESGFTSSSAASGQIFTRGG
jgi:hypothetical protein